MQIVAGVALAGLVGASLYGAYKSTRSQKDTNAQLTALMNQMGDQNVADLKDIQTPVNPANPEEGVTNEEAESAAEQQRALAAEQQRTYNPTSGLGLTSTAPGRRRTLAGG